MQKNLWPHGNSSPFRIITNIPLKSKIIFYPTRYVGRFVLFFWKKIFCAWFFIFWKKSCWYLNIIFVSNFFYSNFQSSWLVYFLKKYLKKILTCASKYRQKKLSNRLFPVPNFPATETTIMYRSLMLSSCKIRVNSCNWNSNDWFCGDIIGMTLLLFFLSLSVFNPSLPLLLLSITFSANGKQIVKNTIKITKKLTLFIVDTLQLNAFYFAAWNWVNLLR